MRIFWNEETGRKGNLAGGEPPYPFHPCHAPEEAALLRELAKNAEHIVEIGMGFGGTSVVFLTHKPESGLLTSIDTQDEAWMLSTIQNVESRTSVDQRENWDVYQDESVKVAKRITKPVDLIFIDGDHTWEGVSADFNSWLPLMREGGMMVFHDAVNSRELPVMRFVDSLETHPQLTLVCPPVKSTMVFKVGRK